MTSPKDQPPSSSPSGDPLHELEAMKVIAAELKGMDEAGVRRVLRWATEAFTKGGSPSAGSPPSARPIESRGANPESLREKYPDIADFYTACGPTSDVDKALVVGYWSQVIQNAGEFDSASINRELKHLGYGVGNITAAFDGLQERKPQLVIQTKKSGTSRQARKLYKLTMEGQRAVQRMLGENQE